MSDYEEFFRKVSDAHERLRSGLHPDAGSKEPSSSATNMQTFVGLVGKWIREVGDDEEN